MKNKTSCLKYGVIVGLGLMVILAPVDASAWGGGSRGGSSARSGGGYHGGGYGGFRGGGYGYHSGYNHGYGYYSGGPYWPYWYGFTPYIGAYVAYLPDDYTTVVVDGAPYYYSGGYYFSPYSSGGYVVVPEPVANDAASAPVASATDQVQAPVSRALQTQPNLASKDTTMINIPNSKGGFTPVRLIKHKNGYIGPQGEFYAGHPTVDALKALYGD